MINKTTHIFPQAERIKVKPSVILKELDLSLEELDDFQKSGRMDLTFPQGRVTLEVEGTPVAEGRIVKRKGEYYFKVIQMAGEDS